MNVLSRHVESYSKLSILYHKKQKMYCPLTKTVPTVALAIAMAMPATIAYASTPEQDAVTSALKKHYPGTSNLGALRVGAVNINDDAKTITAELNETAAYIPLTQQTLAQLKNEVAAGLGDRYADYDVNLNIIYRDKKGNTTDRVSLDQLVLFAPKNVKGPTETDPFISRLDADKAPAGLDGKNIALWQSHGWYFEPKLNRFEWQRARIFQTVEDLFTQSYVMPYLMPMLENAGAYVMSPRERDTNPVEIIIDNDGALARGKYTENGSWSDAGTGFAYKNKTYKDVENPFRDGTARKANVSALADNAAHASWTADFPKAGNYAVYVSYTSLPESAKDALYRVNSKNGSKDFRINQQMGGGTWIYLGHFDFDKGTPELPVVELIAQGANGGVVSADAVKIGGGTGNIARKVKNSNDNIEYDYVTSDYPRFTEGARYWLQWAGAPDSVFTPSGNVNDYTDDYRCRGLWVNWLTGGSSMLPDRAGLKIPVDLSFAWHSDAGTTMNDSIIGTLGIYCTAGDKYANGSDRNTSRDFCDLVMTNIVDDVRAQFEPNWTRRGMWNSSYYEARVPEVPAMLLEFLSHQNLADMKYGLDPNFRFTVSRAVYKGMLKYLAHRDGREYVVQPLPVHAFAINGGNDGRYNLTWSATPDSLEATAMPTYYNIEERVGDGGFRKIARVTEPRFELTVNDEAIHSYRIIAGNDGGVSFPSEVLALAYRPGKPVVTIVNGFTRVSAPDTFDSGEIAGFYDAKDAGVPYVSDISYIGPMFEFRRNIPWMDDDAAGFGASRANYEKEVIAGNTFDFVYAHGRAITQAGMGFISSSVEAFTNTLADADCPIVDLILGKQKEIKQGRGVYGTRYKTFPTALQNKIKAMTAVGTSFFVSGAYVATDLWDNPNSSETVAEADQKFATEVLGYHWRVGQASVTGQAYEVQSRFKAFNGGEFDFSNIMNSDCYAVESPDSFYAPDTAKGATIMRYSENNLVAGTAFDPGTYRTVVIGFPFETIKGADAQAKLMKQVLSFLNAPKTVSAPAKATAKGKKNGKKNKK